MSNILHKIRHVENVLRLWLKGESVLCNVVRIRQQTACAPSSQELQHQRTGPFKISVFLAYRST